MTEHIQTRGGVDIDLLLEPDTPASWNRLSPDVLSHIDRLATAADALATDWWLELDLTIDGHNVVLTAQPATSQKEAA